MKRVYLAKLALYLRFMLPILGILIGMVCISYGAWLIVHPAGFIVGGFLIIVAVILAMIDSGR